MISFKGVKDRRAKEIIKEALELKIIEKDEFQSYKLKALNTSDEEDIKECDTMWLH